MSSATALGDGQATAKGGMIVDFVRPAVAIAAVVVACFIIPFVLFVAIHQLLT